MVPIKYAVDAKKGLPHRIILRYTETTYLEGSS